MKLDLNRVLELPGEADVVTADVDLTTVKHAGRPLFTAPVNVTAKAVNRAGVVTLDCTYRFTLHVLCDRCLAPLELPVDRTVSHTVVREVNGEDDETFLVAENGCVELEKLATNDILPELPDEAPAADPETDYVRNDPHALSALPDMVSTRPEQTTLTPPPASEPLRLVGEVFKTYIITERGSELCLIDKHAAHERILFEQLARDYGSVPSQMLLVPVQVNLTAAEKQAVLQNLDLLTDAGIEAEDFGGSTVVVRAVPADVPVDDVEDMIVELAAKLADGGRDALREKTEWVLHSIACRAAIKAGDRTNAAEMLALAQRIMDGTVPPFCPHGRPCVLKITRKELEKQFGRLV